MKNRMPQKKKRRNSVELTAMKRFEKSCNRRYGVPAKLWLCGERTSDGVTVPCRLRRGEGYAIREDESAFQNTETVFCRDWGGASTSMKPWVSAKAEICGFRKVGPALRCLPLSYSRFFTDCSCPRVCACEASDICI